MWWPSPRLSTASDQALAPLTSRNGATSVLRDPRELTRRRATLKTAATRYIKLAIAKMAKLGGIHESM